jgi:toxin ParE1/3/4
MARPRIVRSATVRRDLRDLYVWIVEDNGLERAEMVISRLESALDRLARRPLLGRPRPDIQGEPRSFPVRPWLVVYEPLVDGGGIHLLRVIDGRRDIAALMGKKS